MIVLATGSGRCGTMTFARFFKSQGYNAFHERDSKFMLREMKKCVNTPEYRKEIAKIRYEGMKGKRYFESFARYFMLIEELYNIDNNIKFIILMRDKDEVLNSWRKRNVYKRKMDGYLPQPPADMKTNDEQMNWLYCLMYKTIFDQLSRISTDSYIIINLEELKHPKRLEKKLADFVPIKKGKFNWSKRYNASKK